MIIGILNLEEQVLYFSPTGKCHQAPIRLDPGATLEISLAGIWIPVEVRVEYGEDDIVSWFRFVTHTSSYCGFVPGMIARMEVGA